MKIFILGTALCGLLVCASACSTDGKEAVKNTVSTVLQIAWENGGKDAANAKIDELVAAGKLTAEQAEKLKAANITAVEKLLEALKASGAAEVEVQVSE